MYLLCLNRGLHICIWSLKRKSCRDQEMNAWLHFAINGWLTF